jgi:hypothetical protein
LRVPVRRPSRRRRASVLCREINSLVKFRHRYRDADFGQQQKIAFGGCRDDPLLSAGRPLMNRQADARGLSDKTAAWSRSLTIRSIWPDVELTTSNTTKMSANRPVSGTRPHPNADFSI